MTEDEEVDWESGKLGLGKKKQNQIKSAPIVLEVLTPKMKKRERGETAQVRKNKTK